MLSLALILTALAVTPQQAERAEKLAEKALTNIQAGKIKPAYNQVVQAVKLNPESARAHYVLGYLAFLVAQQGGPDSAGLLELAQQQFALASELDPSGVNGGLARGAMGSSTAHVPSLPVPEVVCPAGTERSFADAEAAFSRGDMPKARALYLAAIEGCPQNPTWKVYVGDTWFSEGNTVEAIAAYQEALKVDPCNWQAHRFLADAKMGLGITYRREAYGHLVDALACNPNYQEARGQLGSLMRDMPGNIHWPVAPPQASQAGMGEPWRGLAAERQKGLSAGMSALEAEKAAVIAVLATLQQSPTNDEVFVHLAKAQAEGKLEAAIFALLLDEPLFDAFLSWRPDHLDAFRDYVAEVPLP
jgi:tetratricopeptide (TPR) repeat protein